jgi:dihydrodipicolinate synthase/N-acetylneuraminate lyase
MAAGKAIEEKVAEARTSRPIYVYEIPAKIGVPMKSVGLVELTSREEMLAAKLARGDGEGVPTMRMATELAKMALVQVDCRPVSASDGSVDKAWEALGAKGRNLVLTAYVQIHHVSDEDTSSFIESRQVRV